MYFDTHMHFNSEEMYPNIDTYIENCMNNKVTMMTVVGYDMETSRRAIEIAQKYEFIYAAVGIGPNDCLNTTQEDLDELDIMLTQDKVVALGEIGLDYYWDDVPKERQHEMFLKQLELAKKHNKPVVIHSRDALQDTFDMLKASQHYGIMHCYSGSYEMAKEFVKIGFYISLAGPVTFKNGRKQKEVAKGIDIDHLLIETDSPYLAPVPFRGKRNEPANVIYVAKEIANQKGMDVEDVARITTFNAKKVFGIK